MVAKAEKKKKLDYMIDKMQRILAALNEIRDNDVTETEVLKKYGLDHKTFRNMVYDHDWDAATRVDGRKKKGSAEKVEGVVPTRSWAEDLFVELYRVKDCSIPIPDDVTERLEEVISELPGDLPKVMFMLYRDGLTLKEAGEELQKSGERVRQLKERALRMLRNQRRTAFMLMGESGEEIYISRVRAEELREKAENDYTCRMMRKEIERLDRLIYAKNKILKDEQEDRRSEEIKRLERLRVCARATIGEGDEKSDRVARARVEIALVEVDQAAISTIHGFCRRALLRFAFETGSAFRSEFKDSKADEIARRVRDWWRKERNHAPEGIRAGLDLARLQGYAIGLSGKANPIPLEDANEPAESFMLAKAAEFAREYEDDRQARDTQTFDDLLHGLRDALREKVQGPHLAALLREEFKAALVDEFQDTDPVQYEIFRRVFLDPAAVPRPPPASGCGQ